MLYPFKFRPIYKEKIWGARHLEQLCGKVLPEEKKIGESVELSTLEGEESEIAEGRLEGNDLSEMIEVFMGELVGDSVYAKFGLEMPILVKLLDVNANSSVQVNPDDALADERQRSFGKTKMWYVVDAKPGAKIGLGFKNGVTANDYFEALEMDSVNELLNIIEVFKGDSFFVPAGTVHYIGAGVVLAEIQQTSDINYRIYDWDRAQDNERDLDIDLATEAIDFEEPTQRLCVTKPAMENNPVNLVNCDHFVVQLIKVRESMLRDFFTLDSFVVYVCVEGSAMLGEIPIACGQTVMIPATIERLTITGEATLLETFMMIDQPE